MRPTSVVRTRLNKIGQARPVFCESASGCRLCHVHPGPGERGRLVPFALDLLALSFKRSVSPYRGRLSFSRQAIRRLVGGGFPERVRDPSLVVPARACLIAHHRKCRKSDGLSEGHRGAWHMARGTVVLGAMDGFGSTHICRSACSIQECIHIRTAAVSALP